MVSLWWDLLCKCLIYTLKSDQWITIWWAKFELECLLLIFIYFNSKFKVTCKNGDFKLNAGTSEHIPKKICLKFLTLHLPFCLFPHQNIFTWLPGLNTLESYFFWWNYQMHFKMVHSNPRKAKSRVCQSHVCYLHTTHSSVLKISPNVQQMQMTQAHDNTEIQIMVIFITIKPKYL